MEELTAALHEEGRSIDQACLDAEAFGELYERYFPRVYNYISFRVPDRAAAEDLTAAVLARAFDRLHTYRPGKAPFGAWLFRIAHNAVIDHYRTHARHPTVSLEEVVALPTIPSAEAEVERREETNTLLAALAKLPAREQDIVALKFGAGLTNRHIGEVMGLRPGHVGVILYRAVRQLRDHLAEPASSSTGREATAWGRKRGER